MFKHRELTIRLRNDLCKPKITILYANCKTLNMKKIASILALICLSTGFSQDYSKVKIYTDSKGLQELAELGVAIDHGTYKENTFFISDFSTEEIAIMQANGFRYDILIADVKDYYRKRSASTANESKNATCSGSSGGSGSFDPVVPANYYENSSYMGYLKYQDMLNALDAMAAQYPSLITVKQGISTFQTNEGRPIYYVKISDNPSTDESAETKVLYTAIHHAREPLSMSQLVFYMWYLLENYSTSEEIQFLLNNTEMYFIPCLNPDGYLHNETTDPSGGGMHRKNKRNVGTSNPGVDNNRNYSYGWNTTGVSSNPNNDTYPGTSEFSEPENQAIKWLCENVPFTSSFNAHTYGNTLLHPIGTTEAEYADHHDYFQDLTSHMCELNGYLAQKSSGLYPASGDSDDYMYKVDIGVGVKDTIFAMTPEIGSDFWPAQSEILPTCKGMVFPNLVLSHMTHKYLIVNDTDPSTVNALTGNFNHSAYRLGLESGAVTVSIEPLQNIQSVGSPVIHDINLRASENGSISFSLNPAINFGDEIKYVLKTEYGTWTKRDTIIKTFGQITLQQFENADNSTNWTGTWGTTPSIYYSASNSFTESISGNYQNDASKSYQYNQTIDLTNANAAMITYYAKWSIETDYDYCQFQVSVDGGTTWIGQCGNYTVPGTNANGSIQPNNQPLYEGTQNSWVLEEINLSDYLGQIIKVRFNFESDGGVNADGFYFDDFSIMYNETVPSGPTAAFSASETTICEGATISFTDASSGNPTSWNWNFGDGETSTDQSPVHTYAAAGTYTVTLTATNANGSDNQEMTNYIVVEDCSGIDEMESNIISIYPNPNNGIFVVKGAKSGTMIKVFDASGRIVYERTADSGEVEINLQHHTSGKYMVVMKNSNDRDVKHYIVKN